MYEIVNPIWKQIYLANISLILFPIAKFGMIPTHIGPASQSVKVELYQEAGNDADYNIVVLRCKTKATTYRISGKFCHSFVKFDSLQKH